MGEGRTFMLRYAFFFLFSSFLENLISVMKENFYLLFRPILKKGEYLMSSGKEYKFLAYILISKNDLETLKKYKIRRQGLFSSNYQYCNDYVFPKIFIPSALFLPSSIKGYSILRFPGIYDMRFCKYSNSRCVVVYSLEIAEQITKYVEEILCK